MHARLPIAMSLTVALAAACAPALPTAPTKRSDRLPAKATSSTSPTPTTALATPTPAPPRAFFGRVIGLDGQPVAGVPVRGFLLSNNGAGLISDQGGSLISNNGGGYRVLQAGLETKTDAEGYFALKDPEGRALNLEAVKSDREKAFRPAVASDASGVTMQLALTGTLSGRVLAPAGVPATDLTGVDVFVPGTSYQAKTDADGRFSISHMPVGTFRLVATKRGLGQALVEDVAVTSDTTSQSPDLQLAVSLPAISAIAPANAGPGLEVTITGERFGASAGKDFSVTFGGAAATTPQRVDDRTIKVKVPAGARTGDVVVTVDGVPGPAKAFTVIQSIKTTSAIHDVLPGATHRFPLTVLDTEGRAVASPAITWRVTGTGLRVAADGLVTAEAVGSGAVVAESGGVALAPHGIKVHDAPWVLTTLAGHETESPFDWPSDYVPVYEGTGVGVQFYQPYGLTVAADGTIYVADMRGAVCRVSRDGQVTTLAGASASGTVDGQGAAARFNEPAAIALHSDGTLYVGDRTTVRRIAADGTVTTLAGRAATGYAEGAGAAAAFNQVRGLAVAANGDLYVLDAGNKAVRRVTPAGVVSTVAGGPAAGVFSDPTDMAMGPDGHLYVADGSVKQVTTAGVVTPVSGLSGVEALDVAANGTIVYAEDFGYVKQRTSAGTVSTVAADGSFSSKTADGTGTDAGLSSLHGLALGPDGAIYLTEWGYDYVLQRVRKLSRRP